MKSDLIHQRVSKALDSFAIELPSWGFSNTGTRFGKFIQPAAAITLEHKFCDAAEVNRLTGVTPTLTLAYTPSEDMLFYATIAKGFRPGGGNQPVPVSGGASCLPQLQSYGLSQAPTAYGSDSVWSYELGQKATLLGGRLTFNADVYYEVWRHIQQQVPPCELKHRTSQLPMIFLL